MIDALNNFWTALSPGEKATFIGVCATLLATSINIWLTVTNNKRTTFINTVTSSRIKWMGELRELISDYTSLIFIYDLKPILKDKELREYLDSIIKLDAKIKLHLNYDGEPDKKIIEVINTLTQTIFDFYQLAYQWDIQKQEKRKSAENFIKLIKENDLDISFMFEPEKDWSEVMNHPNYIKIKEVVKNSGLDISKLVTFDEWARERVDNAKIQKVKVKKLVEETQTYLKIEWERVKQESKTGELSEKQKNEIIKNYSR